MSVYPNPKVQLPASTDQPAFIDVPSAEREQLGFTLWITVNVVDDLDFGSSSTKEAKKLGSMLRQIPAYRIVWGQELERRDILCVVLHWRPVSKYKEFESTKIAKSFWRYLASLRKKDAPLPTVSAIRVFFLEDDPVGRGLNCGIGFQHYVEVVDAYLPVRCSTEQLRQLSSCLDHSYPSQPIMSKGGILLRYMFKGWIEDQLDWNGIPATTMRFCFQWKDPATEARYKEITRSKDKNGLKLKDEDRYNPFNRALIEAGVVGIQTRRYELVRHYNQYSYVARPIEMKQ